MDAAMSGTAARRSSFQAGPLGKPDQMSRIRAAAPFLAEDRVVCSPTHCGASRAASAEFRSGAWTGATSLHWRLSELTETNRPRVSRRRPVDHEDASVANAPSASGGRGTVVSPRRQVRLLVASSDAGRLPWRITMITRKPAKIDEAADEQPHHRVVVCHQQPRADRSGQN